MPVSPAQIVLPENGLLRALQRLDLRLAVAVAAFEAESEVPEELDEFRGLYLTGEEVSTALDRRPGEPAWSAALPEEVNAAGSDCGWLRSAVAAAGGPGYELDPFDADLVLIALAPEVDLRYERVYAFLQDDVTRRRPTAELALSLLCPTYEGRLAGRARLAADAPLISAGLLRLVADPGHVEPPLLAHYLKVDDQLVGFALGQHGMDARLARYARLTRPGAGSTAGSGGHGLSPALVRQAGSAASAGQARALYLRGRPGTGRASVAGELAAAAGADLLTIDINGAAGDGADVAELVRLGLRHARFNGVIPCLTGIDVLWSGSADRVLDAALAELNSHRGVVVLTGSLPWPPAFAGPVDIVTLDVPMPDLQARRDGWREAMTSRGLSAGQAALDVLAGRFRLSVRQIEAAVSVAAATAAVTGEAAAAPELMAAARALTGHELAAVATRLPTRASWEDLVLPAEVTSQLRELCDRITASEVVLGDWGLGARLPFGHGVTALFTGPPGTGKTTGAAIVAGELGLDLYRIDLSRVVSKYIGDTEKNLDRVFTAADDASAVLLFDEADALFGKRSAVRDAHDRYANTEVAYLLQKMEEYEGIAILATNLQENLDDAFARRLAFTIGFPFPDEASRRQIWAGVWTAKTPLAGDLDLDLLAKELTISGGSIRNIGIAAAFLAAANGGLVTMAHVVRAARRECHKLGRAFPEGLSSHVR